MSFACCLSNLRSGKVKCTAQPNTDLWQPNQDIRQPCCTNMISIFFLKKMFMDVLAISSTLQGSQGVFDITSETSENTQRRKVQQMQPMWLCILWRRHLEDTLENTQWRKIKQMQSVWLYILLCMQFDDTLKNTHWRKSEHM